MLSACVHRGATPLLAIAGIGVNVGIYVHGALVRIWRVRIKTQVEGSLET